MDGKTETGNGKTAGGDVRHFRFPSELHSEKFRIVVPTDKEFKEGDEHSVRPLACVRRMDTGYDIDVEVVYRNSDGLSKVFNDALDEAKSDGTDFLLCVHDDLWINDVMAFDKIVGVSKAFDLIGACGGKTWTPSTTEKGRPIIWTVASRTAGGSGFMVHSPNGGVNPILHDMDCGGRTFFATNYGNSPARTLTVDGSFMCFCRKAIETLRFDETFRFHFYDMDVSMSAYAKGLRVGTVPALLTHESLGESVAQPSYMDMQAAFLKKWFPKAG